MSSKTSNPAAARSTPTMSSSTVPAAQGNKTLWAWAIATFFGAGFWKPGPGTAGSIAAALIWLIAGHFTITSTTATSFVTHNELALLTAAAALLLLAIAIPAATIVARETGREDPQIVVADEAVGQWITLIGAPAGLGIRAHRPRPLPPLRHHQTATHPQDRVPPRRLGHHARRRRSRNLRPHLPPAHPPLAAISHSRR